MADELPVAGEETALIYAPVRILDAAPVPSAEDLALINERFAAVELGPDDVFVFSGIASTDAVDYYSTHQDVATSLTNYVADLAAGAGLLDSHDIYRLPLGSSFRAVMEPITQAEGVDATRQVRAGYYLLRGHDVPGSGNTDDYIRGILGGTHRKMSIGFGGPDMRFVCDIDGKDLWDSDYWPGQRLKDGTRVTFTVVDARLYETSIVYKNATPGALIERVRHLVAARAIPAAEAARLEQRWGVRFVAPPRQHFVPARAGEGNGRMDREELKRLLAGVRQRAGKTISAATRQKLEDALTRLDDASGGIEEATAAINALLDEAAASAENANAIRAALGDEATPDGIAALRQRAAAGDAYTARLIEETVRAKTAVLGNEYDAARYRTHLERLAASDFQMLEDEHRTWTEQRRGVFRPGRQVPAGDPSEGDNKYPGLKIVETAV
jgi:hypothetical protein